MIWPFKKNKPPSRESTPADGLYDVHAHLLWEMDDGLAKKELTVRVLDALEDLGYRGVTATPHHNDALFPWPSRETIHERIDEISRLRGGRPPRIFTGGEIMFDHSFTERLERGELPTMGESKAHLVEFGSQPGMFPRGFEETVFRLQPKGISIIIAHCERYGDIQREIERAQTLKAAGAFIQMDLMSLVGRYGRDARKTAWLLLEKGLVDLAATDLHKPDDLPDIEAALAELARWDRQTFIAVASTNPKLLLTGKEWEIE